MVKDCLVRKSAIKLYKILEKMALCLKNIENQYSRAPKMSVPMRTIVAPLATAIG